MLTLFRESSFPSPLCHHCRLFFSIERLVEFFLRPCYGSVNQKSALKSQIFDLWFVAQTASCMQRRLLDSNDEAAGGGKKTSMSGECLIDSAISRTIPFRKPSESSPPQTRTLFPACWKCKKEKSSEETARIEFLSHPFITSHLGNIKIMSRHQNEYIEKAISWLVYTSGCLIEV